MNALLRSLLMFGALSAVATPVTADPRVEGMMPELRSLPAPTWVKPGVRIVWWAMSNSTTVVQNEQGQQVPKGSAAAGYSELTIVAVEKKSAIVQIRSYFSPNGTEQEAPSIAGSVGAIVNASGGAFWVHPSALKALMTRQATQGMQVSRGKRTVDGKEYTGVLIATQGASWLYDERSGVLIQSLAQLMPTPQNPTKGGSTREFRGFQQTRLPWMNSPYPKWTQTMKSMRYTGTVTSTEQLIPGMKPVQMPAGITHRRIGAGTGWLMTKCELDAVGQGMKPPARNYASGIGALGLVLPPKALAALRPGTVLDRNKWGQSETKVVHVGPNQGRNVAIIREEAPNFTNVLHYDLRSGALIYSSQLNRLMKLESRVTLQKTE